MFQKGNHSPPSMIIQDELHLISGPFESLVGHYESLFNSLSVKDKISPKIITSTATVSMAREQIRDLYGKNRWPCYFLIHALHIKIHSSQNFQKIQLLVESM